MRFQAAAMHVDAAACCAERRHCGGAEPVHARIADRSGNEAAAQEVQITQRQDQTPGASAAPLGATENGAALSEISDISRRWN